MTPFMSYDAVLFCVIVVLIAFSFAIAFGGKR